MVDQDPAATASDWSQLQNDLTGDEQTELEASISDAIVAYREVRESANLWKACMGKETVKQIPSKYGFSRLNSFERSLRQSWASDNAPIPEELRQLREYVRRLAPVEAA
jgi:hypothetical protein